MEIYEYYIPPFKNFLIFFAITELVSINNSLFVSQQDNRGKRNFSYTLKRVVILQQKRTKTDTSRENNRQHSMKEYFVGI